MLNRGWLSAPRTMSRHLDSRSPSQTSTFRPDLAKHAARFADTVVLLTSRLYEVTRIIRDNPFPPSLTKNRASLFSKIISNNSHFVNCWNNYLLFGDLLQASYLFL